jgi:hypothetical protein
LEVFGAVVFAPRFGAVVGPLTFLLLLTGIGVRRLILLAGVGIATLPVLYLAAPVSRVGGAPFYFSLDHLAANWIAAGAVLAILGAGLLQVLEFRSQRKLGGAERQDRPEQSPAAKRAGSQPEPKQPAVMP